MIEIIAKCLLTFLGVVWGVSALQTTEYGRPIMSAVLLLIAAGVLAVAYLL